MLFFFDSKAEKKTLQFSHKSPLEFLKLSRDPGAYKECKHIKVAQANCGKILAYQISVFLFDVIQLPKYGSKSAKVHCLRTTILTKDFKGCRKR